MPGSDIPRRGLQSLIRTDCLQGYRAGRDRRLQPVKTTCDATIDA